VQAAMNALASPGSGLLGGEHAARSVSARAVI